MYNKIISKLIDKKIGKGMYTRDLYDLLKLKISYDEWIKLLVGVTKNVNNILPISEKGYFVSANDNEDMDIFNACLLKYSTSALTVYNLLDIYFYGSNNTEWLYEIKENECIYPYFPKIGYSIFNHIEIRSIDSWSLYASLKVKMPYDKFIKDCMDKSWHIYGKHYQINLGQHILNLETAILWTSYYPNKKIELYLNNAKYLIYKNGINVGLCDIPTDMNIMTKNIGFSPIEFFGIQSAYNKVFPEPLPKESIYIIKNLDVEGEYKIGKSKHPDTRIKQIAGTRQDKLDLIFDIPTFNASKIERKIHSELVNKRKFGEWFNLTTKEVKHYIKKLKQYNEKKTKKFSNPIIN